MAFAVRAVIYYRTSKWFGLVEGPVVTEVGYVKSCIERGLRQFKLVADFFDAEYFEDHNDYPHFLTSMSLAAASANFAVDFDRVDIKE